MPLPLAAIGLGLQAASMAGGFFGKKRKHIDPEYLREHFGARAMSEETQNLVNSLQNSPYGQQLLATAAEQGQGFQQQMAAKAAASGLDPSSGGQAGAGDFATSAASQAQTGLERNVKAGFYQTAMPIAAENVLGRQKAYIADKTGGGYADDTANMWQAVGQAAGGALAATGPGSNGTTPPIVAPTGGGEVQGPVLPAAETNAMSQAIAPAGASAVIQPMTALPGRPLGPMGARARTIGEVLRGGRNVQRGFRPREEY